MENLNSFDSCEIAVSDNPSCEFDGSHPDQVIKVDSLVAVGLYLRIPSIEDEILTNIVNDTP